MNLLQPKNRRHALKALALALAFAAAPAVAHAGDSKPITIVVPFPPGSTADLLPRLVAPLVAESSGTQVIVENRPGATGSIGAAYVAHAAPDGHTLMVAPTAILAVNQWVYKQIKYDPAKDFAPIINAIAMPNVWVTSPSFPAKSLADAVAMARSKPGGLSFASGGSGTSHHLCGELLKKATGAELVHVPYKGAGPALQDVIGGQIPLMCDNLSNVLPQIRSGRLRPLAVTGTARHPALPDVPTAQELGFPGADIGVWFGFVAPAGTPKDVVARLNGEIGQALRAPQVKRKLDNLGITIVADTPEHFTKVIAAESERWHALVEATGAVAE